MIKVEIADPRNSKKAYIDSTEGEKQGLIVATRPLKTLTNKSLFFTNSIYGLDMNKDASASGVPVKVHDGTDSALWTASDIVGGIKTTFNSTDYNHTAAGSKSIKVDASPVGDIFQLAKGSDLDCTCCTRLTIWIYVTSEWGVGDSVGIFGFDTGTGLQIGTRVNLENYFNYSVYNTWHKITIPLTDMGAVAQSTTLDTLRVIINSKAAGPPVFYLDDIQFEQTGSTIEYKIEPEKGTWLHIHKLKLIMADAYAGTLADATMPRIPYNSVLGVASLNTGIVYKRVSNGVTELTHNFKKLSDILQFAESEIKSVGSDGTNTWITIIIEYSEPPILKDEENDKLAFTISDDLSGLLLLRISATCGEEVR